MNPFSVRQDIAAAQRKFDYVEEHSDSQANPYAKVAIQTARRLYILTIICTGYPNTAPNVYVIKPALESSPHRFSAEGHICYMHPNRWNPGIHDLTFVVARAAKWLHKYDVYREPGLFALQCESWLN